MPDIPSPRFDFADLDSLTALYPLLARVRAEDPVHWAPQLNGWVTTRYADAVAALRDPALTSQRLALIVQYQLRHSDPAIAKDFERVCKQQMLFRDGAEHHRLRVLGNRGFTPSVMERARPRPRESLARGASRREVERGGSVRAVYPHPDRRARHDHRPDG